MRKLPEKNRDYTEECFIIFSESSTDLNEFNTKNEQESWKIQFGRVP